MLEGDWVLLEEIEGIIYPLAKFAGSDSQRQNVTSPYFLLWKKSFTDHVNGTSFKVLQRKHHRTLGETPQSRKRVERLKSEFLETSLKCIDRLAKQLDLRFNRTATNSSNNICDEMHYFFAMCVDIRTKSLVKSPEKLGLSAERYNMNRIVPSGGGHDSTLTPRS